MLKTLSNPSNLSLVHVSKTCMCYNQMNTPTHAGLVNTYKKPPPLHPSAPPSLHPSAPPPLHPSAPPPLHPSTRT